MSAIVVAAPAGSLLGKEYRLPRSNFWAGAGCAIGFAILGTVSSVMAWTNIDGSFRYPKETAVGCALFWGGLFLMSLYFMRAYLVERLLLWDDRAVVVGSFRTREIHFTEVTQAKWRQWPNPGGSLVLWVREKKAVIHFENYGTVHGNALRVFFSVAIPRDVQTGWETHTNAYVPTPERIAKNQRIAWRFLGGMAVLGVALVAVGIWNPFNNPDLRWQCIITGGLTAALCGYPFLRRRRPIGT